MPIYTGQRQHGRQLTIVPAPATGEPGQFDADLYGFVDHGDRHDHAFLFGLSAGYTYTGTGSTTYATSATGPINVGTYSVTETITNPSYTGTATATSTITPATAPVTVPTVMLPYTGSSIADPGTTTPTGLTLTYLYTRHGHHDLWAERHAANRCRHLHGGQRRSAAPIIPARARGTLDGSQGRSHGEPGQFDPDLHRFVDHGDRHDHAFRPDRHVQLHRLRLDHLCGERHRPDQCRHLFGHRNDHGVRATPARPRQP